jgi:hypothetical protein
MLIVIDIIATLSLSPLSIGLYFFPPKPKIFHEATIKK